MIIWAAAAVALASVRREMPAPERAAGDRGFLPDIQTPRRRSITGNVPGVPPAADCPGIETTLTLKPDGTYSSHEEYLERNARFDAEGAYTLHGNLLTLEGSDTTWYKVEENWPRWLTTDRKEVEGPLAEHYVLRKTAE